MRSIILFIVAILIGSCAIIVLQIAKVQKTKTEVIKFVNSRSDFSIEKAPSQTVKGIITAVKGDIKWQSRLATVSAELGENRTVFQGESLETGFDGSLLVNLLPNNRISFAADSQLEFAQLLPSNFVFNQHKGAINYESSGETPISVRSLHLLTRMENGLMEISIEKDTGIITVSPIKGIISIGYNDLDNLTHTETVPAGGRFVFDDTTRTAELK